MFHFSLRAKLILTTVLIVSAVAGASLYVTQRSVRTTYQKLFEDRFRIEVRFFSESRKKRLEDLAHKCRTLASSPLVVAPLKARDGGKLYENIQDQLDDIRKNDRNDKNPEGVKLTLNSKKFENLRNRATQPPPPRLTAVTFWRVIDAKGEYIDPPAVGRTNPKARNQAEKRGEQVRAHLDLAQAAKIKDQVFGYISFRSDTSPSPPASHPESNPLSEVIATPILDPDTGESLGALLIGLPMQDLGEKAMYEFSDKTLHSGIWLGEKLYTQTIPDGIHDAVAADITSEILHAPGQPRSDGKFWIEGVPHRLFFEILNPNSPVRPCPLACMG